MNFISQHLGTILLVAGIVYFVGPANLMGASRKIRRMSDEAMKPFVDPPAK